MNRIEMQALTAPRGPSPSSISTVVDECEDTVSLPSTESSNEITHAPLLYELRKFVHGIVECLASCNHVLLSGALYGKSLDRDWVHLPDTVNSL